uniref:Uncharacterized protein n=2 Tax=Oryza TaxID=4527 RepID=A0A0E0NDT9_ORYRU
MEKVVTLMLSPPSRYDDRCAWPPWVFKTDGSGHVPTNPTPYSQIPCRHFGLSMYKCRPSLVLSGQIHKNIGGDV